jgi:hypothetical protein
MLNHNDSKRAKTFYEKFLLQSGMPAQFWRSLANEVRFREFEITRKPAEGKKKGLPLYSVSIQDQQNQWNQLKEYVKTWEPNGVNAPDSTFILFCCDNIKYAQLLEYTVQHMMCSTIYARSSRPYRITNMHSSVLWKLINEPDPGEAPNVVMVPSILKDVPNQVSCAVSDLMTSSYRIFAASNMVPQDFFDKIGNTPTHAFYIDSIDSVVPVTILGVK